MGSFKNLKEIYTNAPNNFKKHIWILLIGNVISISGIFIQTYGVLGLIGISLILFSTYKYSGLSLSTFKFYRKLTKHKLWIQEVDGSNSKLIPIDPSFYIESDNCSDCYVMNPKEVFEYYDKCSESEYIISLLSIDDLFVPDLNGLYDIVIVSEDRKSVV